MLLHLQYLFLKLPQTVWKVFKGRQVIEMERTVGVLPAKVQLRDTKGCNLGQKSWRRENKSAVGHRDWVIGWHVKEKL